jgi:tetratricopeptide (TPR) repeat protein
MSSVSTDEIIATTKRQRAEYRSLKALQKNLEKQNDSGMGRVNLVLGQTRLTNETTVPDSTSIQRRQLMSLIQAHLACPTDSPNRVEVCLDLAPVLYKWGLLTLDESVFVACAEVETEIVHLQPDSKFHHSQLGYIVGNIYDETNDPDLLVEAVWLNRKARSLQAPDHPDRYYTCFNLSLSLWRCFERTGDYSMLEENIALQREMLELRCYDHPDRDDWYNNFALSLEALFQLSGNQATLLEAIENQRVALSLRSTGHPKRHYSCHHLANLLYMLAEQTQDGALLEESIVHDSEALSLRAAGHPDRPKTCRNLAIALYARFEQTGDSLHLDRSIQLRREALELRPIGDPDRRDAYTQLASALKTRFEQTGDDVLLDEIIRLDTEALDLQSTDSPDRASLCINLANSLLVRFEMTGDGQLLDKAIQLHREAYALRPADHPERDVACSSLAGSLWALLERTGDSALLDEAIRLDREALALRPVGHPLRPESCRILAYYLRVSKAAEEKAVSDEISSLLEEALSISSIYHPHRPKILVGRASLAMVHEDFETAVLDVHAMLNSPLWNLRQLLEDSFYLIRRIDIDKISTTHQRSLLTSCKLALDLLTLANEFAFDRSSQLRRLVSNLSVGPRAFFLSCRLSDFPMGLQLLERARGTIWMQQLSMRDPQIDDIPRDMAMKLETILREINQTRLGHVTNLSVDKQAFIPDRDILHEQRNQLQHILHEVRALPGLQDFMRGPDGPTLLTAATRSPIVVLVADRKECRALIIPSSHEAPSDVILNITQAELLDLTSRMSALHSRGGQESDTDGAQRALGIAKVKSASHTILAKLWQAVVKPVLAILQLEVSAPFQLKAEHD